MYLKRIHSVNVRNKNEEEEERAEADERSTFRPNVEWKQTLEIN